MTLLKGVKYHLFKLWFFTFVDTVEGVETHCSPSSWTLGLEIRPKGR